VERGWLRVGVGLSREAHGRGGGMGEVLSPSGARSTLGRWVVLRGGGSVPTVRRGSASDGVAGSRACARRGKGEEEASVWEGEERGDGRGERPACRAASGGGARGLEAWEVGDRC